MNNLFKKYVAEFIGTFVLVFCACGAAILTDTIIGAALAFGLVIVAMAYSIGRISGCHINPAVSIAFLIQKKMTLKEFFGYVCAQILGGFIGAVLLFGIFKMADINLVNPACNGYVGAASKAGNIIAAILVEIVLTCIFVFVILHVTDEKSEKVSGKLAGLIIGATLTLVHLVGINLTGTSVNPARSLATALGSLIYDFGTDPIKEVWVFIIAPLAGGALAAILHTFLTKDCSSVKEETKEETEE